MRRNYYVYMHISPSGKRYIGITIKKPEYRWNHGDGYKKNAHFYRAIKKYGWNNFEHIILAREISKKEACELEQRLIKQYDSTNSEKGYNHSTGGECGGTGVIFTETRREKIGAFHKGMKHTEDAKKRMSEGHKGKPSWNKGRSWTAEEKEKFMQAQKGKAVMCVETGAVYFGAREAERKTGIGRTEIRLCCHGRRNRKTAGGFHWRFAS